MKQYSFISKTILAASVTLTSWGALAAPGILEDLPLNLSTRVQPNILFLLDDSGSMDWEQLISQSAQTAYGVGANGRASDLNFAPTTDTGVNELCLQYNVMAYDPSVVYEPWSEEDEDDIEYGDKTLTTALDNPYDNDNIQNISNHFYMSWVDDGDSVFEVGECGNYASIASPSFTSGTFPVNTLGVNTSSTAAAGYVVDSGGISGNYSNNETFGFLIQPAGATQITLSFAAFNVEAGFDFLRVYNGTSNAAPLVATLDGGNIPSALVINSGSVFLEFTSDFTVTRSGFILFWNHSSSGVTTPPLETVDLALCSANANCTAVANLPTAAAAGAGVTNTQENYANWYTYYRKREYIAKKALSDIIDNSTSRLGLATLHNNGSGGTIIQNMQNATRKSELFDNLFGVFSSGGTPLRQNLEQVGQYFEEGTAAPTGLLGFTPNHSTGDTISSDSPILSSSNGGTCQQNFSVVFSDGFWNGGDPAVGDQDSDSAGNPYDGGTFADTYLGGNASNLSNTLADVAMRYLKQDLSTSLPNVANIPDVRIQTQDINHQHLTTYTVAFGLDGTLSVNPDNAAFTSGWTDPIANNGNERIDDMRHAAWNGRGEFLSAGDPQELIGALTSAIDDIGDRTGTAAAASFNSGSISSDTLVYQSVFSTENWTGDLLAFRFDDNGVVDSVADGVINSNDAIWSASVATANQFSGAGFSNRSVMTYNGTQGVPFEFPNPYTTLSSTTLNSDQVNDLLTNAPDPSDLQNYGNLLVDYLKGDNSNEIGRTGSLGLFRDRNGEFLGPFVHSSPQYVAAPSDRYPNLIEGVGNEYSTFAVARDARRPLVYIGGNDGMLHAFDGSDGASGGTEVFAYIPGFLVNNLHTLSETDYSHLAYVDATPTIRDVFVNGQWRTYLVGGARSGGRGIYVLDVTDPGLLATPANANAVVEFEFEDPDLGFTFSRPQIARMNDGSWVAVVANGYNSDGDGSAKLFIIDLETGTIIREIDTGVGTIVNSSCNDVASDCNGLSSPTIADLNGDFIVDRIYAGDVHGNMWVFDVSDTNPGSWGVAFGGQPLFTACGVAPCSSANTANRQPITVKPEIIPHPSRRSFSTSPNVLVYFGTGQFLAENDDVNVDTQSFYAVWDSGSSDPASTAGGLNKSNLQQQSFANNAGTIGVSNNVVDYLQTGELGWYIDLSVPITNAFQGGRAVINPLIINQIVFFIVTVPSGEICNRDGDTFLITLDAYDGTEANFNVFDTDNDGVADSSSPAIRLSGAAVGLGSVTSGIDPKLITTNSDGTIDITDINTGELSPPGRKSWSILR